MFLNYWIVGYLFSLVTSLLLSINIETFIHPIVTTPHHHSSPSHIPDLTPNPPDIDTPSNITRLVYSNPLLGQSHPEIQNEVSILPSFVAPGNISFSSPLESQYGAASQLHQSLQFHTSGMMMATPSSGQPESPLQRELPRTIQTPGKELGQLVETAQDGWEKLFEFMGK